MKPLSPHIQTFLNDPDTRAFLKAARQYVALMESETLTNEEFFRKMHKTLAELYLAALSLKDITLVHSDGETDFLVPEDEIMKIHKSVFSYTGDDGVYWKIFDPSRKEKPVQVWLQDDLADIYRDLKRELYKIDRIGTNEAVEDALWQLKFGFKAHWGHHCVDAMRVLHYVI